MGSAYLGRDVKLQHASSSGPDEEHFAFRPSRFASGPDGRAGAGAVARAAVVVLVVGGGHQVHVTFLYELYWDLNKKVTLKFRHTTNAE